jgi:hypothetical protein
MKAIQAMNGRGGKEFATEASGTTGLSSVGGGYRARKNSPSGYTQNASRNDNQSAVGGKFHNAAGRGEFATKLDSGDGYCKK